MMSEWFHGGCKSLHVYFITRLGLIEITHDFFVIVEMFSPQRKCLFFNIWTIQHKIVCTRYIRFMFL